MTTTPPPPGQRLRALMDHACVPMPGAFSALCARAIAQAGFPACYVSGAATSVLAGVPDVGILTLEHFTRTVREVADAGGLPVIADADTGFGEAEMARRTVIEYARAGAAGLHLEDQVFPKRCGHLDGKKLIPIEHQCEKIASAVKAAREFPGFIVCARTDARGVEGFDAAVKRAQAYVQSGADMIFPEGLTSEEEFTRFALAMGAHARPAYTDAPSVPTTPSPRRQGEAPYLLANMTEFGKTPIIPVARFAKMGYSCVIFPVSLLRIAMGAVTRALEVLKQDGSVHRTLDNMQTREQLYKLIGYTPGVEWEWPVR